MKQISLSKLAEDTNAILVPAKSERKGGRKRVHLSKQVLAWFRVRFRVRIKVRVRV